MTDGDELPTITESGSGKTKYIIIGVVVLAIVLGLIYLVFFKSSGFDFSMDSEKISNPIELCTDETFGLSDTCIKGAATYNQDISLCDRINETSEKRQECLLVLNSGKFMFREHISLEVKGANRCENDPKDFKAKCQERCTQENLVYVDSTEYNPELKTSSVNGYFNCKLDPKTVANFWGACYCY